MSLMWIDERQYGTAAAIAAALGPDVTVDMVRKWHRRDGLPAIRIGRTVYHPFLDAAIIEARKRRSTRGRPRRVDKNTISAP